jgi:hypothetical protein
MGWGSIRRTIKRLSNGFSIRGCRRRGRLPGQLRIRIRYRRIKGAWFDYLRVSQEEMNGILQGTAWVVTDFIDDSDGIYAAILKKRR